MDNIRPSDPDERDRRSLIELIRRGQCVLVLGPRVAVRPDDPDRRPLDEVLAEHLLAHLPPADDGTPAPQPLRAKGQAASLRQAAEVFRRCDRGDRLGLEIEVHDFFQRHGQTPTEFHTCLAQLPFQLCINASLDDMMTQAFNAVGKTPRRAWFDFNPGQPPAARLALPSAESPLVYHLLGHPEAAPSMVLGEGDLIDFMTAIVRNSPALPDQVRSVLADEQSSFLFLGFGFHNWYLRLLLKVLNVYNHRNPMLALEDAQFFSRPDSGEAEGFFSGERAIRFRALRWEVFARWLLAGWTERAGGASAAARPVAAARPAAAPAADAPQVFISYASEDRDAVAALADDLTGHGLRVWRDAQGLRVGDAWDTVLVDLIRYKVDYVVVVQTPAMLARPFGVFNAEVKVALARQAEAGSFDEVPLRFILPVTLNNAGKLPALKHLHVIAVDDAAGVAALAQSVFEDWARRAQMVTV